MYQNKDALPVRKFAGKKYMRHIRSSYRKWIILLDTVWQDGYSRGSSLKIADPPSPRLRRDIDVLRLNPAHYVTNAPAIEIGSVPRLAQAFHDADGGVFHGGHTLIERFGRCKHRAEIVGMRERLGR